MATAIHIELNILCLVIMGVIVYQSIHNVNQQTRKVLFRYLAYGIIAVLILDSIWKIINNRMFPGAVILNYAVNSVYLAAGILLGGIWFMYVKETLGNIGSPLLDVIIKGFVIVYIAFDLLSVGSGLIFYVTEENVYTRGPLFWVQTLGAIGIIFAALIYIFFRLLSKKNRPDKVLVYKLLSFYILPVIGFLFSLPFTGMPGTWTCASISIVLIYMDSQDREIHRDTLTGLNNRRPLTAAFADYTRQVSPEKPLYLMLMDLDKFKNINDSYGHPAGDQALIAAARALGRSVKDKPAIICRYGGDEFLVMGFLGEEDDVTAFKKTISRNLKTVSAEFNLPFRLSASIGYARYEPDMSFDALVNAADQALYQEKSVSKKRP